MTVSDPIAAAVKNTAIRTCLNVIIVNPPLSNIEILSYHKKYLMYHRHKPVEK